LKQITNILIIGNGNVALQLALLFNQKGYSVDIYGRDYEKSVQIAERTNANVLKTKQEISDKYYFVFYCVKDSVIAELVEKFSIFSPKAINLHCSGTISISVFDKKSLKYGVFYPLQTFSKEPETNWKQLPILIEGNNVEVEKEIAEFAKYFSENTEIVFSEKRLKIHLAAVIVNNFVNHLYHKAFQILEKDDIEFKILEPLIRKTIENALKENPLDIQTGPAKRNDVFTLNRHKEYLKLEDKELLKIYESISNSIKNTYNS
jgi:predicted short-subunit dehydrogenase-like oxidoreductase (DUF2520 family)